MRRLAIPLIVVALALCGFVPTVEKVLSRCLDATPTIAKPVRVTLNSSPGKLFVGEPGKHSLIFDDGRKLTDPGLEALSAASESTGVANPMNGLWRLLDFYSPSRPRDFLELLSYCSIDANRRGWVRQDEAGDKLAITIGALGESERDFPQLWLDRATSRIVRLALPNGVAAFTGPQGADNLPQWVSLDGGKMRLEFLQPQAPAKKK